MKTTLSRKEFDLYRLKTKTDNEPCKGRRHKHEGHSWRYKGQNEHATYYKCNFCGKECEI